MTFCSFQKFSVFYLPSVISSQNLATPHSCQLSHTSPNTFPLSNSHSQVKLTCSYQLCHSTSGTTNFEKLFLKSLNHRHIYSIRSQFDCQLFSNTHSLNLHSNTHFCAYILSSQGLQLPVFLAVRSDHLEFELR